MVQRWLAVGGSVGCRRGCKPKRRKNSRVSWETNTDAHPTAAWVCTKFPRVGAPPIPPRSRAPRCRSPRHPRCAAPSPSRPRPRPSPCSAASICWPRRARPPAFCSRRPRPPPPPPTSIPMTSSRRRPPPAHAPLPSASADCSSMPSRRPLQARFSPLASSTRHAPAAVVGREDDSASPLMHSPSRPMPAPLARPDCSCRPADCLRPVYYWHRRGNRRHLLPRRFLQVQLARLLLLLLLQGHLERMPALHLPPVPHYLSRHRSHKRRCHDRAGARCNKRLPRCTRRPTMRWQAMRNRCS